MTRIDQLTPGQANQTDKQAKPAKSGRGPSFQEVLDKAAGPETFQGAESPASAQQTRPAAAVRTVSEPTMAQRQALTEAEKALALLDDYQAGLGNPDASLKQLDGVVRSMERQKDELTVVMGRLDPNDRLHEILGQVAATTEAETIKFRRGDYLP